MKGTYRVAILYVTILGVVATPSPDFSRSLESANHELFVTNAPEPRKTCPPKGSTGTARIAHNCNCDLYYECEDGEQILQKCPTDAHFDYAREVCDSIGTVRCLRPILTYPETSNRDSVCSPAGKAFQHESNSSAYYLCLGDRKILRNCAAEQHFHVNLQRCEYSRSAASISDLFNFFLLAAANACPTASSRKKVTFPHECVCTKYYECVKGRLALRFCKDGLYYDRVSKKCIDPVDADCEHKYPKKCPPAGSSEKVFLPHECTCFQYYECVKGRKALRFCKDDLYFDRFLQICTDPNEADCALKTTTEAPTTRSTKPTTTSTKTSTKTTATTSTTKSTKPTKSTKSTKSTECTTPTTKTEKTTESTTTESTTPRDKPRKKCPAKGTARIAHNTLCERYYDCVNGKATENTCPIGQHFDWVWEVCDWIAAVHCIRPLPFYVMYNDLDPATCIGTCPDEDPEDAVLLPNDDCKKFCLCSNGIPWVQPCPEPLYFDSVDKVCKYKKDAVCGTRSFDQHLASAQDKIDDEDEILLTNQEYIREYEMQENAAPMKIIYDLDPAGCIGTCPEEDPEDAVLLPHDDCKKFCLCSNGIPWVQPCPEPLYFDSIDKVCKYKKDAVCGIRLFDQHLASAQDKIDDEDEILLTNQEYIREYEMQESAAPMKVIYDLDPAGCIGTCPEEDPEDAVLLPHEDCKKFCLCSNGIPWVQPCPEPLYFDSIDKVCKYKKDAVCGVRSFDQHLASAQDKIDGQDEVVFLTN